MVIPLLEPIDIAGKTITADALLTQRKLVIVPHPDPRFTGSFG